MTPSPNQCSKCKGAMEQGFVDPDRKFRCSSCGYLEFYARPEFTAQ